MQRLHGKDCGFYRATDEKEVIFMKILVDEMPVYKDDCWFSDTRWVDDHWEPYCVLGPDGITDCDLENGECSKLHSFQLKLATTEQLRGLARLESKWQTEREGE